MNKLIPILMLVAGAVMAQPPTTVQNWLRAARPAAVVATDSPGTAQAIAYWTLDETSGNRGDSKGTNTLTPVNTPGYTNGVKGNAIRFVHTSSQYVKAPMSAFNFRLWTNWSYNYWAATRLNNGAGVTFAWGDVAGAGTRSTAMNHYPNRANTIAGIFTYYLNQSLIPDIATNIAPTAWNMFTVQYTGTNWQVYTNSKLSYTLSNTNNANTNSPNDFLTMGCRLNNGAVNAPDSADLDEFGLWSKVLTPANITWLYNAGAGRTYTDL